MMLLHLPRYPSFLLVLAAALWGQLAMAQEQDPGPPNGFQAITLGMSLEAVKAALQEEPLFDFVGDPDVSLLPTGERQLIETDGTAFIERGYFQFADDALFLLTLRLDPARVDYFSMLTTLSVKYGDPGALSPRDAVWQFGDVRMSLERPVVVKYQNVTSVDRQIDEATAPLRLRDVTLELFLGMF